MIRRSTGASGSQAATVTMVVIIEGDMAMAVRACAPASRWGEEFAS